MRYDPPPKDHEPPLEPRKMREPNSIDKLDFILELEDETDVLLDPSLFTSNALESTLEMVRDVKEDRINCYISKQFLDTAAYYTQQSRDEETVDALYFFESYDGYGDIAKMLETIQSSELLNVYDLFQFYETSDLEAEFYQEYFDIAYAIKTQDRTEQNEYESIFPQGSRLGDILFEELVFGLTRSKIASRLKKVYKRLSEAVGPVLEVPVDKLQMIYTNLKDVTELPDDEFDRMWKEVSQSADQKHLGELVKMNQLRETFKGYSPNWIGTPMKYTVPALVGVMLSPYGLIPGIVGQATSISSSIMAYNGCVWLADP